MIILYITDVSQVQYFLKYKNEFEGLIPMTGDIASSFLLQNNQVKYINEWDFFKPITIEKNWNLANTFSKKWWTEVNFEIPNEILKYFEATSQDMVYPLEAVFNAYSIYQEIFKKFTIDELHGFFLENQAVIRTGPIPTHRAVRSIAQSILFYIADKHEIPFKKIEINNPLSNDKLVKST